MRYEEGQVKRRTKKRKRVDFSLLIFYSLTMMIPSQVQIVMFEVRQGEKNTADFKDVVTTYLADTYDLNWMQAAIAYRWAEVEHSDMESIFYKAAKFADFARRILKNERENKRN